MNQRNNDGSFWVPFLLLFLAVAITTVTILGTDGIAALFRVITK
jgi:hypothetical protein